MHWPLTNFVPFPPPQAYASAASGNTEDAFGKSVFPDAFSGNKETAHFYVAQITPCIHYTMGGLAITPSAHVYHTGEYVEGQEPGSQSSIIPRLYAAGEVAGTVHGANRLGGNSLLECVVFGRVAAEAAVTEALEGQSDHDEL